MTPIHTARPWSPSCSARGTAFEDYCAADPGGPAAHWAYEKAAIGVVLSGWFEYSSQDVSVFAGPGTLLLGNAGDPFTVRHADTHGNRRLVVALDRDVIREVANEAGIPPRFSANAIPPGPSATYVGGLIRALSRGDGDAIYLLAHVALPALQPATAARSTAMSRARVRDAVRYMEAKFDQPCPLQSLAEIAGVSRFQFIRTFSNVVGVTPNQYLINLRLRAAADLLLTTETPVAQVIYDVGFNDVSYFYACFRGTFRCTPRQWRLRA
jgi:AraC family transcriptional regulator